MISNSEGLDLALMLDVDVIRADIAARYAHLIDRKAKLLEAGDRFKAATLDGILDEQTQANAADFQRQLKTHIKDIDAARTSYKEPVLGASRTIDKAFKADMADPISAVSDAVSKKMLTYALKKAAEEAARRAEEAERQRRAAEEAARAAEDQGTDAAMMGAIAAEQAAEDAAAEARAKPADLARVRSDAGSVASLVSRRTWQLDDVLALAKAVAAGKAPAMLLTVNKPIADAMARDKAQTDFPGLRFVLVDSLRVG